LHFAGNISRKVRLESCIEHGLVRTGY